MKLPKLDFCFDLNEKSKMGKDHELNKKIYNAWIHMLVSI